ncbi:hypothetical protein PSPO01_07146 [Paraphaeosphaeria sporulosa]
MPRLLFPRRFILLGYCPPFSLHIPNQDLKRGYTSQRYQKGGSWFEVDFLQKAQSYNAKSEQRSQNRNPNVCHVPAVNGIRVYCSNSRSPTANLADYIAPPCVLSSSKVLHPHEPPPRRANTTPRFDQPPGTPLSSARIGPPPAMPLRQRYRYKGGPFMCENRVTGESGSSVECSHPTNI